MPNPSAPSAPAPHTHDVLIAGCGIAGLVLARLLAGDGWRVLAVGQPRKPAWEGLSPRVLEGFRRVGCTAAAALCTAPVPRKGRWNGRLEPANVEYIVERAALDAALWADAAAAGAELVNGRVSGLGTGTLAWASADGSARTAHAPVVVEARGRQAPRAGLSLWSGPRTVALAREVTPQPGTAPGSGVASFPDGWVWFAVLPDGRRVVQVFTDAEAVPTRAAIEAFHDAALADVPDLRAWLGDGRPVGAVSAREATPLLAPPSTARPDSGWLLRAGDAALAIDPLSGHGMYEAIGGAMALAPVIATLLEVPADAALALRFHHERALDAFRRHAAIGQAFYRQEEQWPDRPFWAARRAWAAADCPALPAPPSPRVEIRPTIAGRHIEARPVVVSDQHRRGVWSIDGVPLAEVLDAAARTTAAPLNAAQTAAPLNAAQTAAGLDPEALSGHLRTAGITAGPPAVAAAVAWLARQGLLP